MEGYNREEEYFHNKDKELLDALIHQTVWVLRWSNDIGDRGLYGAWFHHPTDEEQKAFMKSVHPDDFKANTIEWEAIEFTIKERISE